MSTRASRLSRRFSRECSADRRFAGIPTAAARVCPIDAIVRRTRCRPTTIRARSTTDGAPHFVSNCPGAAPAASVGLMIASTLPGPITHRDVVPVVVLPSVGVVAAHHRAPEDVRHHEGHLVLQIGRGDALHHPADARDARRVTRDLISARPVVGYGCRRRSSTRTVTTGVTFYLKENERGLDSGEFYASSL